jgi:hypothetical protein
MPRVGVLSEVQGRDHEVMLSEHVRAEMFANEHYADHSSSAWAGRSSTPSTRGRRFAPDRAGSRGEPHLNAVSGFLRAVEPVPLWHHARHVRALGA